jgi:hypothetical protein
MVHTVRGVSNTDKCVKERPVAIINESPSVYQSRCQSQWRYYRETVDWRRAAGREFTCPEPTTRELRSDKLNALYC